MRRFVTGLLVAIWSVGGLQAAELRPTTVDAFDRYVRATETRMSDDVRDGRFLWIDRLSEAGRRDAYAALQRGQLYIQPERTLEDGAPIQVTGGLIHHWVGVIFVRGATLSQALAVLQDYDNHVAIYTPGLRTSKLVAQNGNDFTMAVQMYRKTIVSVAFNATFDIHYTPLDANRTMSRSYSTRIAELKDPDNPASPEYPVGNDHGFLWRLYDYWHVDARDGGVYLQVESIALTRRVPAIFAWIVNPLIRSIPRGVLSELLTATRGALLRGGRPSES